MSPHHVSDLLNHLAARGIILQSLNNEYYDSQEIAKQVEKSRSSVDRDIRLLKDDDYIDEHPEGYALTNYGKFAIELYNISDKIFKNKHLINQLPSSIQFTLIQDAEFRTTGGALPRKPISHVREIITAGQHVRILSPVYMPDIVDIVFEDVKNGKLSVDIVSGKEVVDIIMREYVEGTRDSVISGGCTLWKTDDDLPFAL